MTEHPTETEIELFILRSESITGAKREAMSSHFGECVSCRELARTIGEFYAELETDLSRFDGRLPVLRPEDLPRKADSETVGFRDTGQGAVGEVQMRLPFRIARWVVRHPVAAAAGGAFSFAMIALALWLLAPGREKAVTDRNPVTWDVRGVMLLLQNRYGEAVGEVQTVEALADEFKHRRVDFQKHFALADVDADGLNDVVWVERRENGSTPEFIIHGVGTGPSGVNWSRNMTAGAAGDGGGPAVIFNVNEIVVRDADHDRFPEVYAVLASTGPLSRIVRLDGRTGGELGVYQHHGGLITMVFADVRGDPTEEIIAGGMNNAFNEAVVLILDPRDMTGSSTHTGTPLAPGAARAGELAYIRLPRTIVGLANPGNHRNRVSDINLFDSNRSLRVSVIDDPERPEPRPDFHVTFDRDLAIVSVERGDGYTNVADSLLRSGRIAVSPDDRYFERYRRTISWWDGERWIHSPAWSKGKRGLVPAS